MGLKSHLFLSLSLLALGGCSTVRHLPESTIMPQEGVAEHIVTDDYVAYTIHATIDAAPDKVWSVLTDGPAYPTWNSTVLALEGDIAAGEKIALTAKVSPDRAFKLKVSTFEANQKMVWEDGMPFGLFKGVRTFTLEPVNGGQGTHVVMSEVFSGAMHGAIVGSIPDLRPSFEGFLGDLKGVCEG